LLSFARVYLDAKLVLLVWQAQVANYSSVRKDSLAKIPTALLLPMPVISAGRGGLIPVKRISFQSRPSADRPDRVFAGRRRGKINPRCDGRRRGFGGGLLREEASGCAPGMNEKSSASDEEIQGTCSVPEYRVPSETLAQPIKDPPGDILRV
jgi:hypothetical protein